MEQARTAKDVFWEYHCNCYLLDMGGGREEYERLGGATREKEKEWREEFAALWISRIDTVDLTALDRLRLSEALEAIDPILELEDYGDDYAKFWFAYTLNHLAWVADTLNRLGLSSKAGPREVASARDKARTLYQEILDEPNGITERHRQEVTPEMKKGLDAETAEEYVRNYTERELAKMEGSNPKR